ncbi:type I-F CRISPR-associated helicase Cas3f [uncultured Massilia sp.]|uniref:type I-F CRISPR-associated helicase Cas3f n=1 Tax=uncultured Massilia sp. TaxID=169973 RepID=UPI0025DA3FD9|nr:type I-F CRISPR-associated helicase Cas3f [uncultured Massilia sp.]
MNVLFVSQCTKRALIETRRILDQFAERRGDRTWQTPITQAGLDTLRRLLKKSARRNTAVACHWIWGRDHSELLWVVGDAAQFNNRGAVPTNVTTRNILRSADENEWHTGQDIQLLTGMAALLHDLGKASVAFQRRLRGELEEKNQYRHEWVSLRLFEAFVGTDDDERWLARLAAPTSDDDSSWLAPDRLQRDGRDPNVSRTFAKLSHAPLAQAIGWLVVTHHRLPTLPHDRDGTQGFSVHLLNNVLEHIDAGWNEGTAERNATTLPLYWEFEHGLPVTTDAWRKRAARLARRLSTLRAQAGKGNWLSNPYVMHVSRLSLMLADHHYSSLSGNNPGRVKGAEGYPLYANTLGSPRDFNQALDEHLLGVASHGAEVTRALPRFNEHLPRLARHKGLRKRAQDERFRWQDKAADMAAAMRERAGMHGAFVVNMASTGCGKTLGNARIMYGLADPERGMRCAFAMGLRTLTLQTGRAFRDLLGLRDDELAIKVGGTATRELFEHYEAEAEKTGSASRQDLIDETTHVLFEGNHDSDPLLRRIMHDPQVRSLLAAPVLVSTIDHLMPATESERGGRQIAPMLRLMSSDLVLDEPDDFDIGDLPALTRLVHWAGMLGARVLLSSATLPPALVQGLFEAYRDGRRHFHRNRGVRPDAAHPQPEICCAWVDEFRQSQADCTDAKTFSDAHDAFVAQRHARLAESPVRRRAALLPLPLAGIRRERHAEEFARHVLDAAMRLHAQHHSIDPHGSKRVSFGLVRMANIQPLVDVALALYRQGAPDGVRIHLCTYHSQYPLLLRSDIERRLDQALNRRWPDRSQLEPVFSLPDIRQRLDRFTESDHVFIVLGSPVTEVGRDHDYDWAVVEPSSMRSLIQLAGRVRRHRGEECTSPNILVFDTNLRHFREEIAFCKPGFESTTFPLSTHSLAQLLSESERNVIDARPRIVSRPAHQLEPTTRLVDLEHVRIRQTMSADSGKPAPASTGLRKRGSILAGKPIDNAATWWSLPPADALLTAVLQRRQPFRKDGAPQVDLFLRPLEDGSDYELVEIAEKRRRTRTGEVIVEVDTSMNHRIDDAMVLGDGIAPWGQVDYMQALHQLAQELDMTIADCARRYSTVTLPRRDQGWRFHVALGFSAYMP